MSASFILVGALLISITTIEAQDPCPCCSPEHRAFDFWLGVWEVVDSSGTLLGYNEIDIVQDSCILREQWSSATGGYTGTSYNYYSLNDRKWRQVWIDNQGGSLSLSGNMRGGEMVLSSDNPDAASSTNTLQRITWTPNRDGTVRQHWQSRDSTGEWTTTFDGIYRRRRN